MFYQHLVDLGAMEDRTGIPSPDELSLRRPSIQGSYAWQMLAEHNLSDGLFPIIMYCPSNRQSITPGFNLYSEVSAPAMSVTYDWETRGRFFTLDTSPVYLPAGENVDNQHITFDGIYSYFPGDLGGQRNPYIIRDSLTRDSFPSPVYVKVSGKPIYLGPYSGKDGSSIGAMLIAFLPGNTTSVYIGGILLPPGFDYLFHGQRPYSLAEIRNFKTVELTNKEAGFLHNLEETGDAIALVVHGSEGFPGLDRFLKRTEGGKGREGTARFSESGTFVLLSVPDENNLRMEFKGLLLRDAVNSGALSIWNLGKCLSSRQFIGSTGRLRLDISTGGENLDIRASIIDHGRDSGDQIILPNVNLTALTELTSLVWLLNRIEGISESRDQGKGKKKTPRNI